MIYELNFHWVIFIIRPLIRDFVGYCDEGFFVPAFRDRKGERETLLLRERIDGLPPMCPEEVSSPRCRYVSQLGIKYTPLCLRDGRWKSCHWCCLSPPEPISKDRDWICGHFIPLASNLRRWQVMCPKRPSYISFQTHPFYKKKESVGKGVGIQGKV